MKTEDVKIESKIYEESGFPMLQIVVNDRPFRFSLNRVDEGNREWMKDILTRHFTDLYVDAYNDCQDDVSEKFGSFIKSFGMVL